MSDSGSRPRVGVIAGHGVLPLLFGDRARARGAEVFAVAHRGESRRDIGRHVDRVRWVHVGELARIRDLFGAAGVVEVAFCGGIRKTRLFERARPDEAAMTLLARLMSEGKMGDDGLLRGIAEWLEGEGLKIIPSTTWLDDQLFSPGPLGRIEATEEQQRDIELGLSLARRLGEADIGQSVVVRDGVVLAVEAIEGTDACLERGGRLGRGEAVAVKVAKPGQDLRFDLPAVGPRTIQKMQAAGVRVLAGEVGRTLLLDRERVVALADEAGIALLGVS